MNRLVSILSALASLLMIASCATSYYQVATVEPMNSLTKSDNGLVYEDNNCRIEYNFWSQGGNPGFKVTNKTDKDLFIHKDRCFYIFNDYAQNYFKGREYTTATSRSIAKSIGFSFNAIFGNLANIITNQGVEGLAATTKGEKVSQSYELMTPEEQIAVIPPKSYKTFEEYNIFDKIYKSCNLKETPWGKQEATETFNQQTTPIRFSNAISYSMGRVDNELIRVNNDFYVSAFSNYPRSSFLKEKSEKVGCPGKERHERITYIPYAAPNKFWNPYQTKGPRLNFAASILGGYSLSGGYVTDFTGGLTFANQKVYVGLGLGYYPFQAESSSDYEYGYDRIDGHSRSRESLSGVLHLGVNFLSSKFTPVADLKLFAGAPSFGVMLGAGAKYHFTNNIGLYLIGSYLYAGKSDGAISLGLSYGF